MNRKYCIIITGPTAVGKTALAVQLAQYFNTEIISCDSRQCFKEMNIGVAKPADEELKTVKHHFISSHSIHQEMNASLFEAYALDKAAAVFQQQDAVVMVGGTGLYIQAFCEGMDEIRAVDMQVRRQIIDDFQHKGISWLQQYLSQTDPLFFAKGEIKNPQRMMRALEVKLSTGKSILEFQQKKKKQRSFECIKIGLELSREQLVQRINKRTDAMMDAGLAAEVESFLAFRQLNALQTVGYSELFAYFDKAISLDAAIEKIKINTRQYAKRQMTWFKKDAEIKWVAPDFNAMLQLVKKL